MKPRKKIEPWLFLLPAVLVYTFVVIVPVIWSLIYSLYDWNGVSAMKFAGFGNYIKMFSDKRLLKAIDNNFIFMIIGTIVQIFMGLFMATLLYNISKGSNTLRVLYYIPCIISSMAICKIFEKLFSVQPQGMVAAVVKLFGGKPKALLSDPNLALLMVTLIDAYKSCGFYMVIFYAAFMNIDKEIIEAAYIDGCSWFQQYFRISLPMIRPIFITALVLLVNGTLKGFDISYILTKGGPGDASELVSTFLYKTAFNGTKFGYGSAISMFLLLESLIAVSLVRFLGKISDRNSF